MTDDSKPPITSNTVISTESPEAFAKRMHDEGPPGHTPCVVAVGWPHDGPCGHRLLDLLPPKTAGQTDKATLLFVHQVVTAAGFTERDKTLEQRVLALSAAHDHKTQVLRETRERLKISHDEGLEARNWLGSVLLRYEGTHSSSLVDCAKRAVEVIDELVRRRDAMQADSNKGVEAHRMRTAEHLQTIARLEAELLEVRDRLEDARRIINQLEDEKAQATLEKAMRLEKAE